MPQLGETVTEGTVTKWLKAVGEAVERDEPLFEVSTDKVDSEVPSPASGVLERIVVQEGETVEVGTVLAVVAGEGTGGSSAASRAAAETPPAEPAAHAEPPAPAPAAAAAPAAAIPAEPVSPPSAPSPRPAPQVQPAAPSAPAPAAASTGASVGGDGAGNRSMRILSPVVRKLLDENGIDAAEVPGSGLGGRITRGDVLSVIDQRRAGGAPSTRTAAPAAAQAPSPAPAPTRTAEPATVPRTETDEIIPFTNIRRRTAEHMVRSKATSAHTLVVVEADYERVEQVRRSRGQAFKAEEGFSLTYLPFVARATVEALREWPNLNASVGDDALVVHHRVNLGVAVDLDHNGLIVPVVPNAEELTLRGIARRIRDLADRARIRKLTADDISGGTFSITNAGPFGTFLTSPIINQPQVAILSTDGVKRRPTVVTQPDGTEAIAIHSMGLLCLAWDHRAVDGAYAAAFVARVAELLATQDWDSEL
jgi:2-oxoglutarate dehydrogenase E2 component (dihydrolipoamide succinyltransferase)